MASVLPYRQALAQEPGPDRFGTGIHSSASASPAASRQCVSQDLPSRARDPQHFDDWRLQVLASPGGQLTVGQSRVLAPGSYDPAIGTLTVERVFAGSSGVPGVGDIAEILPYFPAVRGQLADVGYLELINLALRDLWTDDLVTLTTVANVHDYDLSTRTWLDRPERLRRVLDPPRASGYPAAPAWRRPELLINGPNPLLRFRTPYTASGEEILLEVRRPADTLVNGADSVLGLTSDASTAVPEVREVVTVALYYAYRALRDRGGEDAPRWAALADRQQKLARKLERYFPRERPAGPEAAETPQEAA